MRIYIKDSENHNFKIIIPTALCLNTFSASYISKSLKKYRVNLTTNQINFFIKALSKYKKKNANWNLLEVDSADGTVVVIKI